jgi:hypothetical protein
MKIVKENRQCVVCGETKPWTCFNIAWGASEISSYLRRVCQTCDTHESMTEEVKQLEKELKKHVKRKQDYLNKISDIDDFIKMYLKQLNTARNVQKHLQTGSSEPDEEG